MKNPALTIMVKITGLILALLTCQSTLGQIRFTEGTINANLNRSGIVDEIHDSPESNLDDDMYLFEEWLPGYVVFVNFSIYDQGKLRYNLAKDELEILLPDEGIKIAPLYILKTFSFNKSANDSLHFINATKYTKYYGEDNKGIHEVLVNDKISLLKLYYIKTVPANYIPAFDLGSKQAQLAIDQEFFLLSDDKLYEINRKKDFIDFFDKSSKLKSFMKKERLKVTKESDLIQIIDHINKHNISMLN